MSYFKAFADVLRLYLMPSQPYQDIPPMVKIGVAGWSFRKRWYFRYLRALLPCLKGTACFWLSVPLWEMPGLLGCKERPGKRQSLSQKAETSPTHAAVRPRAGLACVQHLKRGGGGGESHFFSFLTLLWVSIVSISRFHYEKTCKTEQVLRDLAAAMEIKKENAFLYLMKETDLHKSLLPWWLTRSLAVRVFSALQISTRILDINKKGSFWREAIQVCSSTSTCSSLPWRTHAHAHTLTHASS